MDKSSNYFFYIIWLVLGFCSLFLLTPSDNFTNATTYCGVLILLHGFLYFTIHGGRYITPSGLFLLFAALLHGFSSIYVALNPYWETLFGHFLGAFLNYLFQITIYHFFSFQTQKESNFTLGYNKFKLKNRYFLFSLSVMFPLLLLSTYNDFFRTLAQYTFYAFTTFLTISFTFSNKNIQMRSYLLIFSLYIVYFLFMFDGFGRINMATLTVIIGMVFQFHFGFRPIKFLGILSFFPMIAVASLLRGGSIENIESGLGSVVSPFLRQGQLIQLYLDKSLDLSWGQTIYAAFVVVVPRRIWPSKPWNFNRQITEIFAPEYLPAGHSEAAVFLAEMIYNFGIVLGFIFGVLLIGWLCLFLDKKASSLLKLNKWRIEQVLSLSIIIIASSGMMNLLWGGFSTFINRDGFRILILLILFIIAMSFRKALQGGFSTFVPSEVKDLSIKKIDLEKLFNKTAKIHQSLSSPFDKGYINKRNLQEMFNYINFTKIELERIFSTVKFSKMELNLLFNSLYLTQSDLHNMFYKTTLTQIQLDNLFVNYEESPIEYESQSK